MREPADLRELLGDDVAAEELERLERVDTLLRSVPPPPGELPHSLTHAVARLPDDRPARSRRRLGLAVAFAALAVAALAFGAGRWSAGEDFEAAWTVEMRPTEGAAGAAALIAVGEEDANGNRELVLDISGLPPLESKDEYYALWLSEDGEWAATCGYFSVGEGETTVRMSVTYDIRAFDAWVISRAGRRDEPPPLLEAEIRAT